MGAWSTWPRLLRPGRPVATCGVVGRRGFLGCKVQPQFRRAVTGCLTLQRFSDERTFGEINNHRVKTEGEPALEILEVAVVRPMLRRMIPSVELFLKYLIADRSQ